MYFISVINPIGIIIQFTIIYKATVITITTISRIVLTLIYIIAILTNMITTII